MLDVHLLSFYLPVSNINSIKFVFIMMSYLTPKFCDFGEINYSLPRETSDRIT